MGFKNNAITIMLTLIFGDQLIGIGAFYAGIYIRFGELQEGFIKYQTLPVKIGLFVMVLILSSFFLELYEQEKNTGKKEILLRSFFASVVSFFVLSALYYMLPLTEVGRGILVISLMVFVVFQSFWHIAYRFSLRLPVFAKKVLILGTGPKAERIGRLIIGTNHQYVLSGYISCPTESLTVPAYHVVCNESSIAETARKERIHKIVISLSERRGVLPLRDIMSCKMCGVDILDSPSFYEQVTGKLLIEDIKPSWFIFSEGFKITFLKRIIKRVFDVVFALVGLLMTAPLIPLIVLLIKIDSPGCVFFRQVRVGEREIYFVLYKFRTMRQDAEIETGAVWTQKNDTRITNVGKFLRKTRLDELPQLFNVLKGDMSLIGPRPERPEFVEKLKEKIPYYSERHFVKPGITGWAQVKYQYGASVDDAIEKLRYDLYYIKNLSPFLDMLIIFETIKVVLFGRGSR